MVNKRYWHQWLNKWKKSYSIPAVERSVARMMNKEDLLATKRNNASLTFQQLETTLPFVVNKAVIPNKMHNGSIARAASSYPTSWGSKRKFFKYQILLLLNNLVSPSKVGYSWPTIPDPIIPIFLSFGFKQLENK